jgi:hypothetical protein
MSLINEALKKAQRQRSAEAAAAGPGGDARAPEPVGKRAKAMPAQTVILLATAATVLVVFSVVFTVQWINRTPDPVAPKTIAAAKPAAPVASPAPQPIVVALPAASAAPAAKSDSATLPPAPVVASATPAAAGGSATGEAASVPPAAAPSPAAVAPVMVPENPAAAPAPDPRIQAFVDKVRIAGIRSSGEDSKVIMNDRVYRVNDIVDRDLQVKLVKVEADALTFSDARGLLYVRTF